MIAAAFVIPGDLTLPTGGYAYDRNVLASLAAHGVACSHVALPGSFPAPVAADLAATEQALLALPSDTVLLIDGLAYGAMPADLIARISQPIVALVHHPLCLEAGLAPARQAALRTSEVAALALARHVIVTSATTAAILTADFGVMSDRITIAEPGTERAARATGSGGQSLHLLAVGSIVPRKAYDVLAAALLQCPVEPAWHLTIVGAVRDDSARAALDAQLTQPMGDGGLLGTRVFVRGAVDDATLAGLYATADVFVLPSLYEGYGMVVTEALARGLPTVCTTGCAAALALDPEALRIVPAGDAGALARELTAVFDPGIRGPMAEAAWACAQTLPTWNNTTRRVADALKKGTA